MHNRHKMQVILDDKNTGRQANLFSLLIAYIVFYMAIVKVSLRGFKCAVLACFSRAEPNFLQGIRVHHVVLFASQVLFENITFS